MLEFLAVLPSIQSAIKVGGGQEDSDRIQFDCYSLDINQLKSLRGKRLKIKIEETV